MTSTEDLKVDSFKSWGMPEVKLSVEFLNSGNSVSDTY